MIPRTFLHENTFSRASTSPSILCRATLRIFGFYLFFCLCLCSWTTTCVLRIFSAFGRRLLYGCCFLMYRLYIDRVMRWWRWWGGVFVEECVERGGVPLQQGSRHRGRSSGPDWTCSTATFPSLFPPQSCWRSHWRFFLLVFDALPQRIQRKIIKSPQTECCDGPVMLSE